MTSSTSDRSAGIDLLRLLSILLVINSHYSFMQLPLIGVNGVAIFFIVSGYCMAFSMHGRTGPQFLAARFWRLVPTLILCATITEAVELAFPAARPDRWQPFDHYLSNLICLPLGNLGCDSFSNAIKGVPHGYRFVDGVYWSLLLEIRFYFLLWALYYLLNIKKPAFIIASLGLLAPLNLNITAIHGGNDLLAHLPFFAFGLAFRDLYQNVVRGSLLLAYCVFVFTLTSYLDTSMLSSRMYMGNYLQYLSCFVVFTVCLLAFRTIKSKAISYLGILTYPLYLLHYEIGMILMKLMGNLDALTAKLIALVIVVAATILADQLVRRYQPKLRQQLGARIFAEAPV